MFYQVVLHFINMRFNEEMRGAEETVFNYQIYKNNPKKGFVSEKGVRY